MSNEYRLLLQTMIEIGVYIERIINSDSYPGTYFSCAQHLSSFPNAYYNRTNGLKIHISKFGNVSRIYSPFGEWQITGGCSHYYTVINPQKAFPDLELLRCAKDTYEITKFRGEPVAKLTALTDKAEAIVDTYKVEFKRLLKPHISHKLTAEQYRLYFGK